MTTNTGDNIENLVFLILTRPEIHPGTLMDKKNTLRRWKDYFKDCIVSNENPTVTGSRHKCKCRRIS